MDVFLVIYCMLNNHMIIASGVIPVIMNVYQL